MKPTKCEFWTCCCNLLQVLFEDYTLLVPKVQGDLEPINYKLTIKFVLRVKHMMTNDETCKKEMLTTKPGVDTLDET